MSVAGIHSNRGDGYQTLVAFDWALSVLVDPEYDWIEIDSAIYSVDDVVVGKTDGTLICCQCKKNQSNFKPWTITDLKDELYKVTSLLITKKKAKIRFYSRNSFGALSKLHEYSTTQPDEASYIASLSKENKKTNTELVSIIAAYNPIISTYEFLRRTFFETTPEMDRMNTLLHERLHSIVSNQNAAYNALWTCLDQLGARMGSSTPTSVQHRLTKEDIKNIILNGGAVLAPVLSLTEVRTSFANTSAIGRSWHREIAGKRIPSPVLNDLLTAIDANKRSILLTGLPGAGKTCVMLSLQEELEKRAQTCTDIVPLFIQSREFANLPTTLDRKAQGLPEQWVEKVARMAEEAHVVVVIDSLDVLSTAREHSILTYFLAQIDRLLLIPNVTVVTACREFDRHYDRRIAVRQWDCELKCLPLNWTSEIVPLLESLGIDTTTIDTDTSELIRNPRELALFVELAQREGSFNVVTSQALAQRYLDTFVRADDLLGNTAMQALEAIANEMLRVRKLVVPHQRFTASQDIQRLLCSLNVLQETQSGELTFGHQTLLDVLVISGAVRNGVLLKKFIQSLPPVPFVRPSIRSFVVQLAMGDRNEFRKQIRAVLTSDAAFHIRRLVAESLAELIPQDGDWPLIRDLRNQHRDVFQVIYTQARSIEWHHFWLKHLVPTLKNMRDTGGLTTHVGLISLWLNDDVRNVLAFWNEILDMEWIDEKQISWQLEINLPKIDSEYQTLVSPILKKLLCLPRDDDSRLGEAVAKCVTVGALEDIWLWNYIAGEIKEEDVAKHHFGDKLHCLPHEFGDRKEHFLLQRMINSEELLNFALESVEHWSQIVSLNYKNGYYKNNFLLYTSYEKDHSQYNMSHVNSENVLLDAMEAAIINHVKTNSNWWQINRERLSFSHEGALRYFAILACTTSPEPNIELIGRILMEEEMLKYDFSFEMGSLIKEAFIYLGLPIQEALIDRMLTLQEDGVTDEQHKRWILKKRAELIVTIPCHLRSPESQSLIDNYEKKEGFLIRQPNISSRGGFVVAPFSFKVFNRISDEGVLRLLLHYLGYERDFDDFLVGGKEHVDGELAEASSRQPTRFLRLLYTHWADISENSRYAIMNGVANYLAYRFGNLQPNKDWKPIEEPDATDLAYLILDELERHQKHWWHNRAASNAMQACAYVIKDKQNAERLVFLAAGFTTLEEECTIKGASVELINKGINMINGNVTESLMILANNFLENSDTYPELLRPTLQCFAEKGHPAIRALILRRLPYLQSKDSELGWDLFYFSMKDATGLWQYAESCLYYAYHKHFDKVSPLLERIKNEGSSNDMETWGRISALAAFSNHVNITELLTELKILNIREAWEGASSVWTHHQNAKQHHEQCMMGIEAGLRANVATASIVAQNMVKLFNAENLISIPTKLIDLCFGIFERDKEKNRHRIFGLDEWLNVTSQQDPDKALATVEIYLTYVKKTNSYLHDYKNNLTQLTTRLFAEAEEREESDNGEMLKRVVSVQDMLLSLGVDGVNDWLKAAERP
ncbi:MAG: AAA family ATPase [Ignavibacteria bacterium]|jgi:hypothetical protein